MPDHTQDLVVRLSTQAGMLMEDAVTNALTIGGLEDEEIGVMLDQLEEQAAEIVTLIKAAKALNSRLS